MALRQEGSHRKRSLQGHSGGPDQRNDGNFYDGFNGHFGHGSNSGDSSRALTDWSVHNSYRHPPQEREHAGDLDGHRNHHGFFADHPDRN